MVTPVNPHNSSGNRMADSGTGGMIDFDPVAQFLRPITRAAQKRFSVHNRRTAVLGRPQVDPGEVLGIVAAAVMVHLRHQRRHHRIRAVSGLFARLQNAAGHGGGFLARREESLGHRTLRHL